MCYPVYGMVHIKEPLLLIGKSSPCGNSGFPLSQFESSFTICPSFCISEVSRLLNVSFLADVMLHSVCSLCIV